MPGGYSMIYKDSNSYKHLCISLLNAILLIFQDFKSVWTVATVSGP